MKVDIKVPSMGESISEATVGAILKPSGSQVAMDDELLELETDKVNQVLYAPQPGKISLSVSSGDVVTIGQVVGTIDTEAKSGAPAQTKEAAKEQPKEPPKEVKKAASAPASAPIKEAKKEEMPLKAKPAETSSASARISRDDYLADVTRKEGVHQPKAPMTETVMVGDRKETRRKMSKIRQVIAKRLVEAQQTAAMLTTFNEVDMSQVLLLREKYKDLFLKEHGVKLGFMSFFVKASVAALMTFPDFNSYIDGEEIVHREYYDIGIAVSTDRGLMVPVVRNCDHLSFAGIEKAIEGYSKKAREGTISMDDLQGGGFTITNGGVFGSLLSTPILNAPQPGILGMHKIAKRAVVVDDQIVIRPMMYLALSYDHRLVDGKAAVSFLVEIKNFLEDPARLVLEV